MTQELKLEIVAALLTKLQKESLLCPICHKPQLAIMPGIFLNLVHEGNLDPLQIGPNGIPAVPLVCQNCGFISQHSLVALLHPEKWADFQKKFVKQNGDGNVQK